VATRKNINSKNAISAIDAALNVPPSLLDINFYFL